VNTRGGTSVTRAAQFRWPSSHHRLRGGIAGLGIVMGEPEPAPRRD